MTLEIERSWKIALKDYFGSDDFKDTATKARNAYLKEIVYPKPKDIFKAFDLTPFDHVRVVILGQDPYINPGQAMGLSFSVPKGIPLPPSLQNIYKEIQADLGRLSACAPTGDLTSWAQQGVLLINSTLTVRSGESNSHENFGWNTMTDEVINQLSEQKEHVVFLLWGNYARSKIKFIDTNKHLVLEAPHPSPLSAHRGFFGSNHFSKTNDYLTQQGYQPIEW